MAEGQIEDTRPRLATDDAQIYFRDFFRLAQRTVTLGMSLAVNVTLDWRSVTEWAVEQGFPVGEAREILFTLRDHYESLENQFLLEKSGNK